MFHHDSLNEDEDQNNFFDFFSDTPTDSDFIDAFFDDDENFDQNDLCTNIQSPDTSLEKENTKSSVSPSLSLNQYYYNNFLYQNMILEKIPKKYRTMYLQCFSCSIQRNKRPKQKIILSSKAQYLKNNFYLVFTNRKKFEKKILYKIHDVIKGPLGLQSISRDVLRSHDKYFNMFENDADRIITYLAIHKYEIIEKIPELKNY